MASIPTAEGVCAAVDAIVPHVDGSAMHALTWANSCAYRVLEGGNAGDLEDLREAVATLLEAPCNARARALVERLSDMVAETHRARTCTERRR
jgi:predicted ATPase